VAGDWIKMRTVLQTSPKVVRIASALKADRLKTVGGLYAVWCLFDAHSEDGRLSGYTPEVLDEMIGWNGFSRSLEAVSWLTICDEYLELPDFDVHNGQSAKRRAQEADRKREARKTSASEADKNGTREEKRRVNTPKSPKGNSDGSPSDKKTKKPAIEIQTFIDQCKADGKKVLPADDPIFDYASKAGIPEEFLRLAWVEFRFRMDEDKARQSDWRKKFRNYVRGNYYKLWWINSDGAYELSTTGRQAEKRKGGQA
jgi:hypothetical protein